jgi:hypothetical protein
MDATLPPTATLTSEAPAPTQSTTTAITQRLPKLAWILVFSVFCIPLGVLWDISWHSTIGRDSFWTAAHIVIYMGGAIPGMVSGWIAFRTHFFGSPSEKAASVSIFGLRAPLGAWLTIWGSIGMLTSAPFDDWWHNAYGLDVKILSPPHTLLALGMYAVAFGVLLQMLSWQNRLTGRDSKLAGGFFLLTAGVMLNMLTIFLTEKCQPNHMRTSTFFYICAWQYPMLLACVRRAAKHPWACTIVALTYMGIQLAMTWLLPLFPGEPKLAPIYREVTHMVPPAWPLLLALPALAMDWLYQRWEKKPFSLWLLTGALAAVYLVILLPVQWNFSAFLISPAAENAFFSGNRQWTYYSSPGDWRYQFWERDKYPITPVALLITFGLAYVSTRIGLGVGGWMAKVRR